MLGKSCKGGGVSQYTHSFLAVLELAFLQEEGHVKMKSTVSCSTIVSCKAQIFI